MRSVSRRAAALHRNGFICLVLAMIFAGCAGATITPETSRRPATKAAAARPTRIVVDNFVFSAAKVSENSGIGSHLANSLSNTSASQRREAIGKQAADALAAEVTKQLGKLGFKVVRGNSRTTLGDGDLLVKGKFLDVDEGNRVRRLVIGFGSGASKLDTQVNVYRVSAGERQSLLQFRTHADSGKMPGAAVTMGAGAAAEGGVTAGMAVTNAAMSGGKLYTSQTEYLSDKTADQVVAYLSEYFAKQGWIPHNHAQKAKLTGAP
ncbi:MAG TPA: DUF4410 domain-containing protein [Candidatus Binataceae bacterium]|nr:DUF4410 domain-containing protein [Candidatus Binataceae bacterium]